MSGWGFLFFFCLLVLLNSASNLVGLCLTKSCPVWFFCLFQDVSKVTRGIIIENVYAIAYLLLGVTALGAVACYCLLGGDIWPWNFIPHPILHNFMDQRIRNILPSFLWRHFLQIIFCRCFCSCSSSSVLSSYLWSPTNSSTSSLLTSKPMFFPRDNSSIIAESLLSKSLAARLCQRVNES